MDCLTFQETISDYLEGEIDPRTRAECGAHRLICRDCRELYNDVREMVLSLNGMALGETELEGLEDRILAATTTGEMLSCHEFDRLLERYFDGVILGPTFQNFQTHFENCPKCRRLLAGIEDAILMCRDAKEMELAVPDSLHDRIVAATSGTRSAGFWQKSKGFLLGLSGLLWTPQMAAAALIFAASSLLVLSRFGSISGMADHAENKARRIVSESEKRISTTGTMARTGLRSVSWGVTNLFSPDEDRPKAPPKSRPRAVQPLPSPGTLK